MFTDETMTCGQFAAYCLGASSFDVLNWHRIGPIISITSAQWAAERIKPGQVYFAFPLDIANKILQDELTHFPPGQYHVMVAVDQERCISKYGSGPVYIAKWQDMVLDMYGFDWIAQYELL